MEYKIIVRNRTVYREFEITEDMTRMKLGTTQSCEFRLNPEAFFSKIEMELEKNGDNWMISCFDGIYISKGDMRKLVSSELSHGDSFSVRYADSGDEVFEIRFMIDFEAQMPEFKWKINLAKLKKLNVGSSINNDAQILKNVDPDCLLEITKDNDNWKIQEKKSSYGMTVNGLRVSEKRLSDYDYISFGGASFFYKEDELYFDKKDVFVNQIESIEVEPKANTFEYPLFNRSTRIQEKLVENTITILDPPELPQKPKENLVASLIPAFCTLALTIVVRGFMSTTNSTFIIFSVCSMTLGILTTIFSFIDSKKKYKQSLKDRSTQYGEYIDQKKAEIAAERQKELEILTETYYDKEKKLEIVNYFEKELFDRTTDNEDFLDCYIGKGRVKSKNGIEFKQQERFETDDELIKIPEQLNNMFMYIEHAPVVIPMKLANAVGVIGTKKDCYEMFKNMVMDLTIRQYYNDVEMFALLPEDYTDYEWIRLFPHFIAPSGARNIICSNEARNNIFEVLYKELSRRSELPADFSKGIHIVIFVMKEWGIKNHPLSKFIATASALNVTFVFFENEIENIPQNCGFILNVKDEAKGELIKAEDRNCKSVFEYETYTDEEVADVALKLAPVYCESISLESTLRKNISLFELLNIFSVNDLDLAKRWNESRIYDSIAAPLGVNAKDEIVYLNLHEKAHGPHGLVAGTTGSGKSEILQTYILSAATIFHPYEISFVIIDFKGGGMVNQFKDLPHLIGAITNIDGREIDRSLKSIKAELLKRQALFAQANVNHIDKYIKLYKEGKVSIALPHLVIIVDEFAELKAEQPEFMKELISAARIGRSLGVHLILATQKPSGQVNEQIWSNSKFKLCLKVQNKEDSNEVLKSPLAAEIREPGRAYLQVGNNELFELLQSAYSGGPAVVDDSGNQKKFKICSVDFSGKRTVVYEKKIEKKQQKQETELEAIVKYVNEYCASKNIAKLPGICLPSLSDEIIYSNSHIKTEEGGTVIGLGIYDDPDNQLQAEYVMDCQDNILIVGAAQTGKTALLQTFIRGLSENYSPNEVSVYIMDFASKALAIFKDLNHVGGVVTVSEDERMKHLIKMLNKELIKRKDMFAKLGITSFHSYKEAGYSDLSHVIVMIDNFGAIKELFSEYEDDLIHIMREGISVGITFIVTAQQTNNLGYRYLSNFGSRIALNCTEKSEYNNVFDRCRMEPKNVPGRSIICINKEFYECQIYLPFEGEKEIDRVSAMKSFVTDRNRIYEGMEAKHIPEVPQLLTVDYLKKQYNEKYDDTYQITIGMDYEKVEPVTIDLSRIGIISTFGKEKSGKTNIIKYILNTMQRRVFTAETKVFVFDDYDRQLLFAQNLGIVEKYVLGLDDFDSTLKLVEEELLRRQEIVKLEGIDAIKNEPLLMIIARSQDIMTTSISKNTVELLKKVVKLGKTMKFVMIFADIENQAVAFGSGEAAKYIKEAKNLLYFDDIANMKLMDVNLTMARQFKKAIEIGDAYFIDDKDIVKMKTVFFEEK